MPSKTGSRKNTKQVGKPKAPSNEDEWGAATIVMKSNSTATRKNKVSSKISEVEEQTYAVPDWEKVGMTEQDFSAMMERVRKEMVEWQNKNLRASMEAEWNSIGYWLNRLENLERIREKYNKKRGWSAEDLSAVEEIDAEIKECEEQIDRNEEEMAD